MQSCYSVHLASDERAVLEGHIDSASHMMLRGWAWNSDAPNDPVALDLLVDSHFEQHIVCSDPRPDLIAHGKGNGKHGFHLMLPTRLLDGEHHELRLRFSNTTYELSGSPFMLKGHSLLPSHLVQQGIALVEHLGQGVTSIAQALKETQPLQRLIKEESRQMAYLAWIRDYDTLSDTDCADIAKHILTFKRPPLISIVMPVYNTPEAHLKDAIESVLGQLYPHWELCIADDASSAPHIKTILTQYAKRDPRIKVVHRKQNGHISEATNSALAVTKGEYIAFLDHDDMLREHALYMMAEAIVRTKADVLYSDEDKIDVRGVRFEPHFKPDWNYHYLLAINYICHFTVIRKSLVTKAGGLRSEMNGSQDHDLLLRMAEMTQAFHHVPHILYHWRAAEGSTALSADAKRYADTARLKAVSEHVHKSDKKAGISMDVYGACHVEWSLPKALPRVSIIIPTRDNAPMLSRCLATLLAKTDYPNLEILVIDNQSSKPETFDLFDAVKKDARVRVVSYPKPFNYSAINNFAVSKTHGELLCFLNNDVEILHEDWLSRMVALVSKKGIGAVGAKLLFSDGRVQHGGIIMGIGGVAGHFHRLYPRDDAGYFMRGIATQHISGATAACLLVRRDVFNAVGGFDAKQLPVAFNDVDLCLKIRKSGYEILFCAESILYHHESISRGQEDTPAKKFRAYGEIDVMQKRWGDTLKADPYYNPNLSLLSDTEILLAQPPRIKMPWR